MTAESLNLNTVDFVWSPEDALARIAHDQVAAVSMRVRANPSGTPGAFWREAYEAFPRAAHDLDYEQKRTTVGQAPFVYEQLRVAPHGIVVVLIEATREVRLNTAFSLLYTSDFLRLPRA